MDLFEDVQHRVRQIFIEYQPRMVRATGQLGTGDTEFPEELVLELSAEKGTEAWEGKRGDISG